MKAGDRERVRAELDERARWRDEVIKLHEEVDLLQSKLTKAAEQIAYERGKNERCRRQLNKTRQSRDLWRDRATGHWSRNAA